MKINIYYGGRGLIGDPTIYVIKKMQQVLEELNVSVQRFDLYDMKSEITTLHKTLKEADGIILASTVEWFGIGGLMQEFLDACWLYGDKEKISKIYMCPVVMSTTYGEREGKLHLANAWEILGGKPASGLCGYVPESSALELSEEYTRLIEKKAENLYRTINQKLISFPASNQAVTQKVAKTTNVNLTPQESEQLSIYASDEQYVAKQKQDIKDLSDLFMGKLEKAEAPANNEKYLAEFRKGFKAKPGFNAIYKFILTGSGSTIVVSVKNADLECRYGSVEFCDVEITISEEELEKIFRGETTFQHGFLGGAFKKKGDFDALKALDTIFIY